MTDHLEPDEQDDDDPGATRQGRRLADVIASPLDLILYRLDELKTDIKDGLQRIDEWRDRMESRVTNLEGREGRREERERSAQEERSAFDSRWGPIMGAGLGATLTAVLTVAGFLILGH